MGSSVVLRIGASSLATGVKAPNTDDKRRKLYVK